MPAPPISRPTLAFFRLIARAWFRLHFDQVLTLDAAPFANVDPAAPLIVYANHSSWWDPMIAVLLAARYQPARSHYAPMDETSLSRNRLLRGIGMFPIDLHSARGARQFLNTSKAIAAENGVLWITPQGRFSDPREQPLGFRPGLAALAARLPHCTVLPLALEYTYWNARRPVAFSHFGKPVRVAGDTDTARLEQALAETMEELKVCVLTRDPSHFTAVPLWSRVPSAKARERRG